MKKVTEYFVLLLVVVSVNAFGADYSEQKVCGETSFAVDFYFPEERTIVEVALGLPNPASEFDVQLRGLAGPNPQAGLTFGHFASGLDLRLFGG